MLGYREVDGGPDITALLEQMGRRVWWFEADDGSQVHLSPNPDHSVVSAAHTAIRLDDDLDPCIGRLEAGRLRDPHDRVRRRAPRVRHRPRRQPLGARRPLSRAAHAPSCVTQGAKSGPW